MIRVLIADSSPDILECLAWLIQTQPDFRVVGATGDGLEAVEKAAEMRPDVVIMDARMPRVDGVEATRLLKRASPDIGVLFFSAFTDYVEAGVAAGSDGYLTKECDPERLFVEIRRIAALPKHTGRPDCSRAQRKNHLDSLPD